MKSTSIITSFLIVFLFETISLGGELNNSEEDPLGLKPKKLILSIGISEFKDETWRDLRFAHKDAQDVYHAFEENGQFDGGETLIAAPGSKGVTKKDFERSIERLNQSNLNEDDTVVVYVSSHGTLLERPGGFERYIVTSFSDHHNLDETSISYSWLIEKFHSLKSRKKVLILAFCYSGNGKSALTPQMRLELEKMKGPIKFTNNFHHSSEGSIILTASGMQEAALESPKLKNDLYTHFLLKGFDEDTNGDGAVSITEAHHFAAQATYTYSRGKQRPSASTELLGTDPIIISGRVTKKTPAMLYAYLGAYSQYHVSVDGKKLGSISKGLSMPEGKVLLTIKDPKTGKVLIERAVRFESGKEYPLERFLHPTYPRTLSLGIGSLEIGNNNIRKSYASSRQKSFRIRYSFDEGYKIYDLGVIAQYFPEIDENIKIKVDNDRIPSDFSQRRQMAIITPYIGSRKNLSLLSSTNRTLLTDFRFYMGPSILWYRRHIDEEGFKRRTSNAMTYGMVSGLGLEGKLPYNLLKFGTQIEIGAYRNIIQGNHQMLTTKQISAYIGTFW